MLVTLACTAIVLLYAWEALASWKAVNSAAVREATNLAQSLAQQTAALFETSDAVLQRMFFWATTRGVGPAERPLLLDMTSVRTPSMRSIDELAVFDATGVAVVRAAHGVPPAVRMSEERAFRYHATHASLAPMVGAPTYVSARIMIPLSRRFNDRHGNFGGIVFATISVASLRPLFDTVDVGRHGSLTLVKTDGTIVLRKPLIDASLRKVGEYGQVTRLARDVKAGTLTTFSAVDGERRMIAFRRLAEFPLIVVVGVGIKETFEGWRTATLIGFSGVCVILVTITLLARTLLAELRRNGRTQARLAHDASRDGLTGLFNRRELDAAIEREWRSGERDASPVSLLMIDADFFKSYNDGFGHQLGDEVLRAIAASVRDRLTRPRDVVARYGGEEFAALLPATPLDTAVLLAEKVRRDVLARKIPHADNPSGFVTVSIGVATLIPAAGISAADLVAAADTLLFEAKRSGRNRVEPTPAGAHDDPGPAVAARRG